MATYIYDVECLKNFFCATFVNAANDAEKHVFVITEDKDNPEEIQKFLSQRMTLIGYNNHSYDDPMLRAAQTYEGEKLNNFLYTLSGKLVSDDFRSDRKVLEYRYPKRVKYQWNSIDLMRILAFDKLGISLKQTAINLRWHRIQDMPNTHSDKVSTKEIDSILDYNLNDVLITKKLYEEISPLRELREELSKLYKADLTSASDSRMANIILEKIYGTELQLDVRIIKDMRTERDKVLLGDCIAKFIKFKSPVLNELMDRISSTYVYDYNEYRYSEQITYAGCSFNLGIGGLHTEDSPGIFETDEKYIIQDMDVASYYPNLIINNNFYPEHLGPDFIQVLKKITEERIAAKKAKEKVKADGLKITINSIFGKMGSKTFWLLDAKQMLSTTLSGQLGLLMLIEMLDDAGIPVISANTDGIVCKIPRGLESKYYEVAKEWMRLSDLELEYTQYKKYVRRDVNSYITEKADGSTKQKGAFLKEVDLKKAYRMPIVAKALHNYFIKGIPVRKTLVDCEDIMEFCISQKTGANFTCEIHTRKQIEKLQKTNRFYITRNGGAMYKRDISGHLTGLYVGNQIQILNNYDKSTPFKDYQVDLSFYEKEVMKIIDEIEPKQMSLFDLSTLGQSRILVAEAPTAKPAEEVDKLTPQELNRLGKNQLVKKIETIVKNGQKVEEISPRYVFVTDFNTKTMLADVYCLAKGIRQTLAIDKKAYKDARIDKGQLVFCSKFEKLPYGYAITEYRITDKIDILRDKLI